MLNILAQIKIPSLLTQQREFGTKHQIEARGAITKAERQVSICPAQRFGFSMAKFVTLLEYSQWKPV